MDTFTRAATNRSLRTIQTELDFLLDASVLTQAQVSQITSILPSNDRNSNTANNTSRTPTPAVQLPPIQPPRNSVAAAPTSPVNEKAAPFPQPTPSPAPPPAYGAPVGIATAEALYIYQPTDSGDLSLAPGERVAILEYMNADWARGRSERSGAEGIFPRSYVRVLDEKAAQPVPSSPPTQKMQNMSMNSGPGSYGNMPLQVAQGQPQQQADPQQDSKVNSSGKRFGKKLGNAAIFGAGASIGSNIVNGIF